MPEQFGPTEAADEICRPIPERLEMGRSHLPAAADLLEYKLAVASDGDPRAAGIGSTSFQRMDGVLEAGDERLVLSFIVGGAAEYQAADARLRVPNLYAVTAITIAGVPERATVEDDLNSLLLSTAGGGITRGRMCAHGSVGGKRAIGAASLAVSIGPLCPPTGGFRPRDAWAVDIQAPLQLGSGVAGEASHLAQCTANLAGHLRQLFGPENHQGESGYEQQL